MLERALCQKGALRADDLGAARLHYVRRGCEFFKMYRSVSFSGEREKTFELVRFIAGSGTNPMLYVAGVAGFEWSARPQLIIEPSLEVSGLCVLSRVQT